jgi:hypothetical protein
MSDTKLLAGFDELTVVRRQIKKHPERHHDRHELVAFRLLRTIHIGRALLRRGASA